MYTFVNINKTYIYTIFMHINLDLRSHALVFIYRYTFINNNKTYVYDLYALVFIYTFINNNNICIYDLYALVFGTSSFVILVDRRRSVPATKRQGTKCPHDEMAGDEVSPRLNGRR